MPKKGWQRHYRRRKSKRMKRQFKWMQDVRGSKFKWRIKKLAPTLSDKGEQLK